MSYPKAGVGNSENWQNFNTQVNPFLCIILVCLVFCLKLLVKTLTLYQTVKFYTYISLGQPGLSGCVNCSDFTWMYNNYVTIKTKEKTKWQLIFSQFIQNTQEQYQYIFYMCTASGKSRSLDDAQAQPHWQNKKHHSLLPQCNCSRPETRSSNYCSGDYCFSLLFPL